MAFRLGIVVTTNDTCGDMPVALGFAKAALARDWDTQVFVASEAVTSLEKYKSDFMELDKAGCEITVCATSAQSYCQDIAYPIQSGSQADHAKLLSQSDRVLAFT